MGQPSMVRVIGTTSLSYPHFLTHSFMTKRTKSRKRLLDASSSTEMGSVSPKKPRLDPQQRQLSRFYEPLVLLYTLGSTREEHTRTVLSTQEDISHLPIKILRRRFLSELAYMCDYDKGGDTVTAIGLESTPQRHVFWVASNSCPKKKIVPFLESLLAELRDLSTVTAPETPEEALRIASHCIRFATPRIKKYGSHLGPLLRKCQKYLAETERDGVTGLAEWLRTWESQLSPVDLCRFAYDSRKCDFMSTLAQLSTEPVYKSTKDLIQHTFGLVRHYIGRLGYHLRAANTLVSCTSRVFELLHDFEVRSILTPPKSVLPPADGKTILESIMVRMLPANSEDLGRYQQALAEMDTKYQLSKRYHDNYTNHKLKPRVHAEIQVLEHFYASKLSFAASDSFIACSKPACFCCLLYFRHHPGQFLEPMSHHKIYLNWRPPDINAGYDIVGQSFQRDILNLMTRDIRKDALHQIDERIPPRAWHPVSLTGITMSVRHEQRHALLSEAKESRPNVADPNISKESPIESEGPTELESVTPIPLDVDVVSDFDRRNKYEKSPQSSRLDLDCFEDDSEEEGGVLLQMDIPT